MKNPLKPFVTLLLVVSGFVPALQANPVVYPAAGTAKGKKLVLIASDHEYRSEETIPALARILAKHHGIDCKVLFGLDSKGEIEAGASNVPGLEVLDDADGLVIFARFLALPPGQMEHLDGYLKRGGPVLGLRTATHAFSYPKERKDDPFYKYHYTFEGTDFLKGFGHQILGQTWVGHYGKNHQQSTRITGVPEQSGSPILRGVKDIHVQAGGYTAEPAPDWTILTMAQPLNGMGANAEADASKKPMASEWTRTYKAANGKDARVFTSLYGASEDLLNPGYRRLIVNGVYWILGLESQIRPDSEIGFVGAYQPNTFAGMRHARGVKPAAYDGFESPIPANHNTGPEPAKPQPKNDAPAKPAAPAATKPTASPSPAPASAPVPVPAGFKDPSPFGFQERDVVALVGGGLADRMHSDGWFETVLQSQLQGRNVRFRNLATSGDRVDSAPRSKGVPSVQDLLRDVRADVVFAFYGYNESFDGKPDEYRKKLVDFVQKTRELQPNGRSYPRIVLFSPIAHENLKDPLLPDGREHNARLEAYAAATEQAANEAGVTYIDLFHPTAALYSAAKSALTLNGVHLNEDGQRLLAETVAKALLKREAGSSSSMSKLREAVLDKDLHWFNRARATDENDVWGSRSTLAFVNNQTNAEVLVHEMAMFDTLTANRDERVWAVAAGKDLKLDDSNMPKPVTVISNVGGGSKSSSTMKEGVLKYQEGQEAIRSIAIAPGFKVGLFADEGRFPGLVNPVQLQVDPKGRLWAAVWPTYPKWEPGREMNDALLILHDDDGDGRADRSTEFAKIQNPLGFELWNGGALVTTSSELVFLKDTDGDDRADQRTVLLQGFGTADTHHAANNLVMGPDGGIYWQSGIFLVHNHEHPWGTSLRTEESGLFRLDPRRHSVTFQARNSPNPHGISFDSWGYQYATDGTGGRAYQVRPEGKGFRMFELLKKEVRPVTASEIVSSTHFPESMQGDFLICNVIGYRGVKHYKLARSTTDGSVWGEPAGAELNVEETLPDGSKSKEASRGFLMSGDKNFRPSDAVFGEDGSLYLADWQNVIIGHMQHNVRDPNRDHAHGRIYRITAEGRPLQPKVAIAGQPVLALLENLKHPVDGIRHRTHVELSARSSSEVLTSVKQWMKQFDPAKKEDAHPLLEALWVQQQHGLNDRDLLGKLLESPEPHARFAALHAQQWFDAAPGTPSLAAAEKKVEAVKKSGVVSDKADLTVLRIATVVEKMSYDVKEFTLKAGRKVRLTLSNPDQMPHNLVIVNPGKADAVAMKAAELGAKGFEVGFIPKHPDILAATKLIDGNKEDTVEFTAPITPGDYPFVCTFPGHHILMRGNLKVQP
jgi:putative membrane-bound dehydrogenase-like protein